MVELRCSIDTVFALAGRRIRSEARYQLELDTPSKGHAMNIHSDQPAICAAKLAERLEALQRTGCLSGAEDGQPDLQHLVSLIKSEPITAFGHKTLMQLVEAGRTDDVIAYLESVSAGYTG